MGNRLTTKIYILNSLMHNHNTFLDEEVDEVEQQQPSPLSEPNESLLNQFSKSQQHQGLSD
jgi:hypothetical protein